MKNSFWFVLILAMGMPTAWGQQTADPHLFVSMSTNDTHTAYAPNLHRALLVQEGSRLAGQDYRYRVHFGNEEERGALSRERAAAGSPYYGANSYHEFTVERTMYLSVAGSSAWNYAPYYVSYPFYLVYWNVNGTWVRLGGNNGVFRHRVFPGDYRIEVRDDILHPELVPTPEYRNGASWTSSYGFDYFEKIEEKISAKIQIELRNGPHNEDIIMDYDTQDNTAKAGEDYVETRGTLFIPAGTTNFIQTISVPILDDEIDEEEEEVFSLILRPINARLFDAIINGEFLSDGTLTIPIILLQSEQLKEEFLLLLRSMLAARCWER